jgi:hypothetical protein
LETAEEVLSPPGASPSTLTLVDDLGREHTNPAIVLVSNNPYGFNRPGVGGMRPALDTGQLGILVVDRPGDVRPPHARAWTASSFEITASEAVPAGIDGEATTLTPPLRFVSRPAALRVRISSRRSGGSPPAVPALKRPARPRSRRAR